MQSLDHIFQYHAPTCAKLKVYEALRPAFKEYAEALTSEKILDEDDELVMELAYENITRIVHEIVPIDTPEYDKVIKLIDEAYDVAIDPNLAIVQLVQSASMFANAAVALNP